MVSRRVSLSKRRLGDSILRFDGECVFSGCNPLVVQISLIYNVWLQYFIYKCAFTMVFDVWLDEHSRCYVWLS